jgi:pimeloyl-ACP methyl ester carboxylesterase
MPPLEICINAADQATQVAFPSAAGETVYGATFGSGDVGVVLAHQYMSDLCEWVPEAKRLRDQGRRVLALDFDTDLVNEVIGAAAELRREGSAKIVLVGASMGGTASLVAATTISPAVVAVASLSGPGVYRKWSAYAAVKQLTIPVLFMDARDSKSFPEDAKTMYATCPSAHAQLVLLPGTDHGAELVTYEVADQARHVLEKFITDSVGE